MKKLLLLLFIPLVSFGQTPITDANFYQAIETCLSTNPDDGMCSDSEYGAMPDWDVSQVTNMSYVFKNINESGGLSGKPLANTSNEVIRFISDRSNGKMPIIGVGGIHSAKAAIDKIKAGADLVQIYTGFIYEGPSLIKSINKALVE